MLWLLEFTRDQHRYRAELRSAPGGLQSDDETSRQAFWYVWMDGEAPRRAFEADIRDEDAEAFRDRIVAAARSERVSRGPRRLQGVPLKDPAYGKEAHPAEKHRRR